MYFSRGPFYQHSRQVKNYVHIISLNVAFGLLLSQTSQPRNMAHLHQFTNFVFLSMCCQLPCIIFMPHLLSGYDMFPYQW